MGRLPSPEKWEIKSGTLYPYDFSESFPKQINSYLRWVICTIEENRAESAKKLFLNEGYRIEHEMDF